MTTNQQPDKKLVPNNDFVDKSVILRAFPISDRTLQSWRSHGGLPHYKINQIILYKWSEVVAFIESRRKVS